MIKNIIFDMGNVLLDYNPEISLSEYCANDEERSVIRRELFEGPEWVQLDCAKITYEEAYDNISKRIDVKYHKALKSCIDNWDICMVPVKGACEFVKNVKDAGMSIYVLSNASNRFYKYFPKSFDMDMFDGIVVSCDVHMLKPDIEIYKTLLDMYKLNPKECLFVDDRIENVEGAISAGMNSTVFEGDWDKIGKSLEFSKKEYVFLDLDGTLTDSAPGITNSVKYALKHFGIDENDMEKLKKFIGPPLLESFMKFYDMSQEDAVVAVAKYREYFGDRGLYENSVYEGITELLTALIAQGKKPVLATSKPLIYAHEIIRHFGLDKYLYFVGGSEISGLRGRKCEVIEYAIDELNITDRSTIVMVGDRMHDVEGAKTCNVDVIGVLYGFGDRAELGAAGADYIAPKVFDVMNILGL